MKLSKAPMPSARPSPTHVAVATPQQRWQSILESPVNPGLVMTDGAMGPVFAPPADAGHDTKRSGEVFGAGGFACALSDLSVLEVSGADAISFLQGQFTNDIAGLAVGQAQRTGLCSPKGRLLSDFLALRRSDSVLLLISQALCETIRKRLSMYVLRAKVSIADVSDNWLSLGLVSWKPQPVPPGLSAWPDPMTSPAELPACIGVGLESLDREHYAWHRMIMLVASDRVVGMLTDCQQEYPLAPTDWWHTGEILAGTARLAPATSDAFVPQMINFELIGGVSFNKGCFPGQEIVARTQYLGKLKRRVSLGYITGQASVLPGTDIADEQGKPVGAVLLSGPAVPPDDQSRQWLLFEARTELLSQATTLTASGHELTVAELPYEIPVPERFERPDL